VPSGSWTILVKVASNQTNQQGGLMIWNRTAGKGYNIFLYASTTGYIQLGNVTAGGVYSFNSNLTNAAVLLNNAAPWYYIQAAYNGTTLTVSFSLTGLPGSFTALGARTVATDLGGAPLEFGIGLGNYETNWDFFRRTA
jgi:hypothetical protein